jgi:3-deoxy-7-phosphoheptulonate synthase
MSEWSPSSWRERIAVQQPVYDDQQELDDVLKRVALLPPLVTSWEVEGLKSQLAAAARGDAFLLQGGDCSENLDECENDALVRKLKIMLQMSLVLVHGSRKPVVRVGRIAGQYAKPRSKDMETRDGVTLPVYRGDIVNRSGFTPEERRPNPQLLLRGYERAGLTLNFIRALIDGGFADLHHPENWDLGFGSESEQARAYHKAVHEISESVQFMLALSGRSGEELRRVDFFTSHEGLHLSYEQAQTRPVPRRDGWYNLSTHYPWIGDRTRDPAGAHVEYFRGIRNPIGMKVGPGADPAEIVELSKILNPDNEPGRLTLIHRFGKDMIDEKLPPLIEAFRDVDQQIVWCADPMHGNTFATDEGIKTRRLDDILSELTSAFRIHRELGSCLNGAHLELTGDNVTECIGGTGGLTEADLKVAYKSQVDPRLNYEQAIEAAFLLAKEIAAPT